MGRNIEKTCNICLKKMRGDHLKGHMEKHTILETKNEVNQSLKFSINVEEVEKEIFNEQQDFKRKLELGTIINNYMNKNEIVRAALSTDKLEALEIYETHGKKLNLGEISWRGWQKGLRKYLDEKCDRKVIWVIGEKGKSCFQENICEENGF